MALYKFESDSNIAWNNVLKVYMNKTTIFHAITSQNVRTPDAPNPEIW